MGRPSDGFPEDMVMRRKDRDNLPTDILAAEGDEDDDDMMMKGGMGGKKMGGKRMGGKRMGGRQRHPSMTRGGGKSRHPAMTRGGGMGGKKMDDKDYKPMDAKKDMDKDMDKKSKGGMKKGGMNKGGMNKGGMDKGGMSGSPADKVGFKKIWKSFLQNF